MSRTGAHGHRIRHVCIQQSKIIYPTLDSPPINCMGKTSYVVFFENTSISPYIQTKVQKVNHRLNYSLKRLRPTGFPRIWSAHTQKCTHPKRNTAKAITYNQAMGGITPSRRWKASTLRRKTYLRTYILRRMANWIPLTQIKLVIRDKNIACERFPLAVFITTMVTSCIWNRVHRNSIPSLFHTVNSNPGSTLFAFQQKELPAGWKLQ